MDNKPKVDDKWISNSHEKFLITKVAVIDGKTWIHYEKLSNGNEYNCLEESFITRYTKIHNESY